MNGSLTAKQEKCYDPRDATLQFVDEDDVLDFYYVGFTSRKAKMSCGHAVTPMSLTNWCRKLLDEGESKLVCGQTGCNVEWPFEEVRKMALLTPEETEYFEKKIFSNAASDLGIKPCPGCTSRVMRIDLNNLSVHCPVCTAKRGRTYEFCWQCLNEWKGPHSRSDGCENDGCQKSLEILKSCPVIIFKDVEGVSGCPSIRACPSCGLLVQHDTTRCKNVVCTQCKTSFCFVCLRLSKECAGKDYSYSSLCSIGVAQRQTSIPVKK